LNAAIGETVSGPAIIPLDYRGKVCIYNQGAFDFIVDPKLQFAGNIPDGVGSTGFAEKIYTPVSKRLLDTRKSPENPNAVMPQAGSKTTVAAGPEFANKVVAMRVTSVNSQKPLWMRVGTKGVPSAGTSNVNVNKAGDIVGNLVFVQLDAEGNAEVETLQATDFTADLQGWFEDGAYVPLVKRIEDTREPEEPTPGDSTSYTLLSWDGWDYTRPEEIRFACEYAYYNNSYFPIADQEIHVEVSGIDPDPTPELGGRFERSGYVSFDLSPHEEIPESMRAHLDLWLDQNGNADGLAWQDYSYFTPESSLSVWKGVITIQKSQKGEVPPSSGVNPGYATAVYHVSAACTPKRP